MNTEMANRVLQHFGYISMGTSRPLKMKQAVDLSKATGNPDFIIVCIGVSTQEESEEQRKFCGFPVPIDDHFPYYYRMAAE